MAKVGPNTVVDRESGGTISKAALADRDKAMIEAIPIPAAVTRLSDGTILYANDLYTDLFGTGLDQLVGRKATDLYQLPEQRRSMLDKLHEKGRHQGFELKLKRADGTTMWAVVSARLLEFDGEQAIFGSLYDITDQKRAQDALGESERRLQEFLDAGSDWFWETDVEHRFRMIRAGGQAPPPQDVAPLMGWTRWQIARPAEVSRNPEAWAAHREDLAARRPFRDFVYRIALDDGGFVWARASGVPMFDEAGEFQGYRGTSTNITAQIEAEERANAAQRSLAAAIDSLSAWVAMFDTDDRLVLANKAWWSAHESVGVEPRIGESHREYLQRLFRAGVLPHARGREDVWLEERLKERRNSSSPHEIRSKDGGWLLVADTRLPDGGLISTYTNITKLKRAELAKSLLQSTLVAANQAPDFEQALRACLEAVCEHTGWQIGRAITLDGGRSDPVMSADIWHLASGDKHATFKQASEAIDLVSTDDLPGQVLASSKPVWCPDVGAAENNPRASVARACSVRSGCAFPVRSGERVVAIVEFFCEEAGEAQDQILEIFDHLGDQLGNVLERRHAEETLRQAQKMEAVGQLTGGLAHDFNNLLAVILGNLELIEDGTFGPDQIKPAVRRAVQAAEQGADLTSRLLAFSRQQPLRPEPTDVNRLITNFVELLQRTLGEHLWIRTDLNGKLWTAEIDRGQLESALLNLAINARDAMPLGGRLLIETDNLDVGPDNREKRSSLKPGRYVVLSVSDTGPGIAQAELDKVFDPFFTTKETGGGSGLGLSMVYGFAKQSRGDAEIQSRLGLGTRVRLYLPATSEAAREPRANARDAPAGAGEVVLVVEDDAEVRALVMRMLTDSGYRALAVDNAADGLKLVDENDAIALLLTDMILPDGADGLDLAKRARARRPSLRTVLMSGYSDRFSAVNPADAGGLPLIAKPFRKSDLARIVRHTLDEADQSA